MTITDRTAELDDVFAARLAVIEARPAVDVAGDAAEAKTVERIASWLAKEYGELLNPDPSDDPPGYWEFQARELLAHTSLAAMPPADEAINVAHLNRQAEWSSATFGPGTREKGVSDHIRKELIEVADATDPAEKQAEWIDVVILALDGAWRSGLSPQQIIAGVKAKQARNEARTWPDWRTADPDKAIEHDRTLDGTS